MQKMCPALLVGMNVQMIQVIVVQMAILVVLQVIHTVTVPPKSKKLQPKMELFN
jgi:hypothetical protein